MTQSTFLKSFPSYPTLYSPQEENPKNCPECPTPDPYRIRRSQHFSGSIFPPLSKGVNPVHLLQPVPELSHFLLALPMDCHWLTTLCRLHGMIYVEPMY